MISKIFHADVDDSIRPFLYSGHFLETSVTPKTVQKIEKKDDVIVLTCKSQSQLSSVVLGEFPNLRLIVARTVGTDNIDLIYCKDHHITVSNIPDYGPWVVAEHSLALILAGAKNITSANTAVHGGKFSYRKFLGFEIHGKTVGIIGTGKIGLALTELLSSFAVRVIAYDVFQNKEAEEKFNFTYVPLEELLATSDIISLHAPLTKETHHLLGEKEFACMKKGAILVNTSRGGLIDTKALLAHIPSFHAVCLDVLEDEAHFTKDDPLLSFPNVIMTPHTAFFTEGSVRRIGEQTMQCIKTFDSTILSAKGGAE